MTNLHNLPVELLYEIHLLAVNPNLAASSVWLWRALHGLPTVLRAHWLVLYSRSNGSHPTPGKYHSLGYIVDASLRHPICTANVLRALPSVNRMYTARRDIPLSAHFPISLPRRFWNDICICGEESVGASACSAPGIIPHTPVFPAPENRGYTKRPPRTAQGLLDTLSALEDVSKGASIASAPVNRPWTLFAINFTANNGAALFLASAYGAKRVVRYLIDHIWFPESAQDKAVRAAIRRKDVKIVRMLVERQPQHSTGVCVRDDHVQGRGMSGTRLPSSPDNSNVTVVGTGSKRKAPQQSSKRRRLSDRIEVTPNLLREAIRMDAREIVDYFIQEKGCTPDVRTLQQAYFQ